MSIRRQKYSSSTELDVFEAAHYFSGPNELISSGFTAMPRQPFAWRARRMSLDGSSTTRGPTDLSNRPVHPIEKQAKEKQPRSPGGRLASFINSLFNQSSSSRKKKPKKSNNNINPSSEPVKEHEEDELQRRKRRSSISHFRFRTTSAAAAEDNINTPTKLYKDSRSYSVAKSFIGDSFIKDDNMVGELTGGGKEGDGGDHESDSSSDLFELKNYDIGPGYGTGCCGSDLPVYETTELGRFNIESTTILVDRCFK